MKKFYAILIGCLMISHLAFSNGGPLTTAGSVTVCNGNSISVPVSVAAFNNVGGISLTLNYNPAMLQYQSVVLNPAITGSLTNGTIPGEFLLSYTCDPGINLPDNATLFTLYFGYVGPPAGGSSLLTWLETPVWANEYSDAAGIAYNKEPFLSHFVNGSVTVITAECGPVTTATVVTSCPSSDIAYPVKVSGFNNVGGISLTLNYDPAMLQYQSVVLNPAITGSLTNGATAGIFLLSYTCDPGINLPDNATLFTLHFSYVGLPAGGTSPITWSETPPEANEYSTPEGIAYNKEPFGNYFINGSISVNPNGCGPITIAPVVSVNCPQSPIAVPVTVKNFNNVGGISHTLLYDGAILQYDYVNLNPAISGSVTNGANPGIFLLSFTSDPGVNLPDNTILYTIYFRGKCSQSGGTSALTWLETPPEANEYSDPAGNAYNKLPFGSYFFNGSVIVGSDNIPPTVTTTTGSLDRTLVCDNETGLTDALALVPAATDNCTNPPFIHLLSDITTPEPGCPSSYSRVRTWNFTDYCNNTSTSFVQVITVTPSTMPVFTTVSDISVPCGTATASPLTYDNGLAGSCRISGSVTSTLGPQSPSGACGGDVTETWTAAVCGNTITTSRVIHVLPASTPWFPAQPVITVACGAVVTSELTYDNELTGYCHLTGTVTSTLGTIPGACGGDVKERWTATVCGNIVTKSRVIHVLPALTPWFPAQPEITVACGAVVTSELTYDNELTGYCHLTGTVTSTLGTIPGACGGDVTETWTAMVCGNIVTTSRVIHVLPASTPWFPTQPVITVACGAAVTSELTYDNELTGSCRLTGTVTSTLGTIPDACGGDVTETWTALVCGNTVTTSRVIHVLPAILPIMSPQVDITVACGDLPAPETISFTNGQGGGCLISGTSNMSTFSAIPGVCGGDVIETWTATDVCGRALASVSRIITVRPAPLPTMTVPANITVSCDAIPQASTISYSNGLNGPCNLSGTSNLSTFNTIIPGTCNGRILENWTASDICGRPLASVSRTITVVDNTNPTISCPSSPQIRTILSGQTSYIAVGTEFDYTGLGDNCNSVSATNNLNGLTTLDGYLFPSGTTSVTWTAVDACGNTANCSYDVIIYSPAIELVKTGTLDLTVVLPNDIANVGDRINYTFKVTNAGNATLYNVMVTDPFVNVSGGPVTLAPGETDNATFTAVYTLNATDMLNGTFTNVASVSGTTLQGETVAATDGDTREFLFVKGNIYDDANGMNNSIVSGSPTNGSGSIYINLANADKGVVASMLVYPDGTYYFTINDGLEFNKDYVLILTNSPQAEGSTLLAASYPTNWVSTGEILGIGSGNDGTIDGILAVSTMTGSVSNANFGLDQLPNSNDASASYANPGGTTTVQVPLLIGSDPEDGLLGSGSTIAITSLATNGTLYYNGLAVYLGQVIAGYNPLLLNADPMDGAVSMMFNYAFIDEAGRQDPSPALVTLNFYLCPVLVTHPQETCSPRTADLTLPAVTAGSTLNGATLTYWENAAATIPMLHPTTAGAGTYFIRAALQNCFDITPVTVTVHPLPTMYNVTGSGSYCAGGQGIEVIMIGSQPGFQYTLMIGCCIPVGAVVVGTGGPLSFGYQTLPGNYSILAVNPVTHCSNLMYNCVWVWVDQPVPVSISIQASANPAPLGTVVTFTASPVNGGSSPVYQWMVNGSPVGTNSPTYSYTPGENDEIVCLLASNAYCVSGNPATSNMIIMGVPATVSVTGEVGPGEPKCYNATQTLIIADGGNTFTVHNGGIVTMIAGHNILYKPGTTVEPGGKMHGYITLNNQYCAQKAPTIPTVTGTEEPGTVIQRTVFSLYPNPTSGNFTVEQKGENLFGTVQVEVFGMTGEKMMTGVITGETKHEFSLPELQHGLYFVKVSAGGNVETFKLVKTR